MNRSDALEASTDFKPGAPFVEPEPGDVLRIKLINDMPPNRDPEPIDHSLPHQFNNTNLHSHGLHVSPSGIADNVMRVMEPGESYDIEYRHPFRPYPRHQLVSSALAWLGRRANCQRRGRRADHRRRFHRRSGGRGRQLHIHTNDMLLTKINGAALAEPIWLDTAILPRNGSITFRSRFVDFAGKFMLHCHMMNHEDLGMMQVVEAYADD